MDNLLRYHFGLGARMNRVELADLRMGELKVNYSAAQRPQQKMWISRESVIMELKMSETVTGQRWPQGPG